MIILTAAQAQSLRGDTANGARLEPVPIKGGDYVLPETVLHDPNHSIYHELLRGLPVRDVADSEWIREVE